MPSAAVILVPSQDSTLKLTSSDQSSNAIDLTKDRRDISLNQNSGNIDLTKAEKIAAETTIAAVEKEKARKIEEAKPKIVMHTIKKGETLQSIAKQYDTSVKQILAANTLKSTKVKVGQTLTIKLGKDEKENSKSEKTVKNDTKKQISEKSSKEEVIKEKSTKGKKTDHVKLDDKKHHMTKGDKNHDDEKPSKEKIHQEKSKVKSKTEVKSKETKSNQSSSKKVKKKQ
jgi:LysM repeat protein